MQADILTRIVDCLAAVTRYPTQFLTVEADLENDLGIDSVKRVEIMVALSEAFEFDLQSHSAPEDIRTIGDIGAWLERDILVPESNHGSQTTHGLQSAGQEEPTVALGQPTSHPPTPPVSQLGDQHAAGDMLAKGQTELHPDRRHDRLAPPHFAANNNAGDSPQENENGSQGAIKPLAEKVTLITGSGRGVGRIIARILASRGAHVVINSFHSREQGEQTVAEIEAAGGKASHVWGSVANPEHVERMFAEIAANIGHLDILICNASDGKIGSFLDIGSDDWDRAFRTNVSGHYQCAIKAAELMQLRGGGSIVTMSAVGAHRYIHGLGSQGVVKAAVETLTRYLSCELGRFGIRVNCVAGGPVYGDLLSKFPDAEATQNHWEAMTPDGVLCSPIDLAETIGFLVSDQAAAINGAVWMVDHGFSANEDGQPLQHLANRVSFATPGPAAVVNS